MDKHEVPFSMIDRQTLLAIIGMMLTKIDRETIVIKLSDFEQGYIGGVKFMIWEEDNHNLCIEVNNERLDTQIQRN